MAAEQKEKLQQTIDANSSDEEFVKLKTKDLKQYILEHGIAEIHNIINKKSGSPDFSALTNDKIELRFIALDSKPTGWNKNRLKKLDKQYRQLFIKKKIKNNDGKKDDDKQCVIDDKTIQLFLNTDYNDNNGGNDDNDESKEKEDAMDEILQILSQKDKDKDKKNKSKKKEKKDNEGQEEKLDNSSKKETPKSNKNDEVKHSDYIPSIDGLEEQDEDEKGQRSIHKEANDDMSSVSTHPSMPGLMSDDESDENDDDDDDDSE